MNRQQEAAATKRRDFLRLVGLGALSSTAAVVASGRTVEAKVEAPEGAAGYRLTAHVKKVYELARF